MIIRGRKQIYARNGSFVLMRKSALVSFSDVKNLTWIMKRSRCWLEKLFEFSDAAIPDFFPVCVWLACVLSLNKEESRKTSFSVCVKILSLAERRKLFFNWVAASTFKKNTLEEPKVMNHISPREYHWHHCHDLRVCHLATLSWLEEYMFFLETVLYLRWCLRCVCVGH